MMLTLDEQQKVMETRLAGIEKLPGYCGTTTCARLYECARCAEPDGMNVEIGSLFGKTAVAIGRGLQDRGKDDRLVCIDPFQSWDGEEALAEYLKAFAPHTAYEQFWITVTEANVDNVDLIVATSQSAAARRKVQAPVRFAFIDGDHRYEQVKADVEWLLPLMPPGAILALDDYGANRGKWGVTEAVDEIVRPTGAEQLYANESQYCIFFRIGGKA